jgi:integrase
MATIQKRTKKDGTITYKAVIRVKGYPTMTASFDKITSARKWIGQNEPLMKEGKHINDYEAKKHTLNDLIDRYIEIELPKRKETDHKKYKMQLEWWKHHIGMYLLSNITPALLSECKEKLVTETSPKPKGGRTTRTGATANRYMACLSIVLSFGCKEWGWIEENPMLKVRKFTETAKQDRFLMPDEINKLLNACLNYEIKGENYNKETHLFVLIALSTGARYSEIHKLRWQYIDFKNKQFYFMNTKNGENRGVPMSDKVYKELKEFQKIRNIKSDYLFTTKDGKKLIDMRVRFYKVLESAGIDCRFHDLRHTVASHIAMNGGSLLDIAQVTGHKTMQMVKRYSHLTQKHTAELLQNTTDEMFSKVENNL